MVENPKMRVPKSRKNPKTHLNPYIDQCSDASSADPPYSTSPLSQPRGDEEGNITLQNVIPNGWFPDPQRGEGSQE